MGVPGGSAVRNPPANAGDSGERGFDPWPGIIPWKMAVIHSDA